jgi:hypothetical protein
MRLDFFLSFEVMGGVAYHQTWENETRDDIGKYRTHYEMELIEVTLRPAHRSKGKYLYTLPILKANAAATTTT